MLLAQNFANFLTKSIHYLLSNIKIQSGNLCYSTLRWHEELLLESLLSRFVPEIADVLAVGGVSAIAGVPSVAGALAFAGVLLLPICS
jgi:hypothetical protein